jgi:hypothetical protein
LLNLFRTGELVLAFPLDETKKWSNGTIVIRGAADVAKFIPPFPVYIDPHASLPNGDLASQDSTVKGMAHRNFWESSVRMSSLTRGWLDRTMDQLAIPRR